MTARTILLVDDDDDLRETLTEQLSPYEEFSLLSGANAAQAMQTARPPRLISSSWMSAFRTWTAEKP